MVPEGSDASVINSKIEAAKARWQEGAGLTMKAKYKNAKGEDKELEVQPGEWVVKVQRPDGSTYEASYKGGGYDLPPQMAAVYGTSRLASIGRPTEQGWSHGMLGKGEKIIEGESGPPAGAGVTMKGRAIPPYTEDEALELSKGIFPEMPPGALAPLVKSITSQKPEEQDSFVNYLRQKADEKKLQEAHDALMKQQSQRAEVQERIEAGTQKRMPLPPKVVAGLKLSLNNYFRDAVRPILQTGELKPTKVSTTAEGKTKMTLPTAERPEAVKVRYAVPDPMDWLNNMVRNPPAGLNVEPDPSLVQASDRQLLQIYDEEWGNYLRHAPSADLEQLRTAHRLDRLDLRGTIPEPELDPLLRILQNVKHGEMQTESKKDNNPRFRSG